MNRNLLLIVVASILFCLLVLVAPVEGFKKLGVKTNKLDISSKSFEPIVLNQKTEQNSKTTSQLAPISVTVCDPMTPAGLAKFPNGTVGYCKHKYFTLLQGEATIARVDLIKGAARAPHWHNVWEVQTCITGTVQTFLIDPKGNLLQGTLKPGMISFAPASWLHWLENVGDSPASIMFT